MSSAKPSDLLDENQGSPEMRDPQETAEEMVGKVSRGATDEEDPQGETDISVDVSEAGSYARELKRLRSRHHLIIRLAATGKVNGKEIADIVGVHPSTVYNTLNSKLAKQKMKALQEQAYQHSLDLMQDIEQLAAIGLAEIEDALINNSVGKEKRVDLAQDLLDRAGYGKTKNVNMRTQKVTDDDIKEIKQEANEKAKEAGVVEDAKVVSESSSDG